MSEEILKEIEVIKERNKKVELDRTCTCKHGRLANSSV